MQLHLTKRQLSEGIIVHQAPFCGVTEEHSPERKFGVGLCHSVDGIRRNTMLFDHGLPDGEVHAEGALGVLLDHVLGEEIFASRPPDTWSVTTELSIDFYASPPPGRLTSHSELLHRERSGGHARAVVVDEDGRTVASATSWARFVPLRADPEPSLIAADTDLAPFASTWAEFLGLEFRTHEGAPEGVLARPDRWGNLFGTMHGGVWLFASQLVAQRAMADDGNDFRVSNVHLYYARPAPARPEPVTIRTLSSHRSRSGAWLDLVGMNSEGSDCVFATVTMRRCD